MDILLSKITTQLVQSVIEATQDVDLEKLSAEQLTVVATMVVHCVFNGPVGVGTETNFPGLPPGSIKSLSKVKGLTNRKWRGLCLLVAKSIQSNPDFENQVIGAQTLRMFGDLWPIKDNRLEQSSPV
jgi:hypothetical protein